MKIRRRDPVADLRVKLKRISSRPETPKPKMPKMPKMPTLKDVNLPVAIDGRAQGNVEAGRIQKLPRLGGKPNANKKKTV